MDAQAQKKALFRAKLKEAAQKREKCIDSPLVRYNEYDQPVCRVCDVTLKSESLWTAHQASRKHHEAIKNFKATAAGLPCVNDVKSDSPKELTCKPRPASSLPANFFDKHETKRLNTGSAARDEINPVSSPAFIKPVDVVSLPYVDRSTEGSPIVGYPSDSSDSIKETVKLTGADLVEPKARIESKPSNQLLLASRKADVSETKKAKGALPEGFFDNKDVDLHAPSNQLSQSSGKVDCSETKTAKGALPEGFFDNKDADLRARGIEPVKLDIKDEYKEFEKAIQEDLQEVDERLVEDEFDAAEMRQEAETLEQKAYRERVEMLKKKQLELKAAKYAKEKKSLAFMGRESSDESSSDGDDEENFTVDWRAKHL